MSDNDLDAGMQQIVADIASDPKVHRLTPDEVRRRDDDDRPMTKRQAREIVEAITTIPEYKGTETNKLLAEIKSDLGAIKWCLSIILLLIVFKVMHG